MSILGEPLDDYVNEQIEIRQKKMGVQSDRGVEMLSWANSKTAWVKLASGVFLDGDDEDAKKRLIAIGLDVDQNKGTQLPQKYVLFGGTSTRQKQNDGSFNLTHRKSFKEIYDQTDTDFGLVPMPGIESIQVNDKNRGSIKEATVEIVAYSRKQLEILDILYLKLGYTMLLEWGNSHYIDNNGEYKTMGTTHTERFFSFFSDEKEKQHPKSIRDMDIAIKSLRGEYQGNYDGFIAKVVNFNWTFQPDGSYKITLKLISYGDVVESFKMNISSPNPEYPNNVNNKSNIVEEFLQLKAFINQSPTSYITAAKQVLGGSNMFGKEIGYFFSNSLEVEDLSLIFETADTHKLEEKKEELRNDPLYRFLITANSPLLKYEEGTVSSSGILFYYSKTYNKEFNGISFLSDDTKDKYRTRYLSVYLKISTTKDTIILPGGNTDVFYINQTLKDGDVENYIGEQDLNNYYIRFQPFIKYLNDNIFPYVNDDQNNPLTKINIDSSRCKYMPNQISFDPRVCIVRAPLNYPNSEKYIIFPELEPFIFYQTNNPDETYGKISNIYLNFGTIIDSINSNLDEKGNVSPLKFLEDLCNKINKAMGGINNLEPRVNDDQEIDIIDSSLPSQRINDPQTAIQIYGYNGKIGNESESTFVRNVNLKTEISPEFASMVTIGSTAAGYSKGMEATAFSKWNKGIVDRFKSTITSPTSGSSITVEEEVVNSYNQYLTSGEGETRLISIGYSGIDSETKLNEPVTIDGELIDTNISVATEFFKYLRAKTYEDNPDVYSSTSNGFIPFNMSLTLDGISGIKIYNKIEVDTRFLPYNYPETLKFIVKRVSHRLSKGDWETTIETTVMPGAYSFA